MADKLFYSYIHDKSKNVGKIDPNVLSTYSDAVIFDLNKRTLWHQGKQFGNAYWGSSYGETFNDFINNGASGEFAHAEGTHNQAKGKASHAEGMNNEATGIASHVQGSSNKAKGANSSAEGSGTEASGAQSHAEGTDTLATGIAAHAEGYNTEATADYAHAEGSSNKAKFVAAHAEGVGTESIGMGSHSEGNGTTAAGEGSHAEGHKSVASGMYSHSEGDQTIASGKDSHAEGEGTKATKDAAHAEGLTTEASGYASHAEGSNTEAKGESAHAEGDFTHAIGDYSHAEGVNSQANGEGSHAEGDNTVADGDYSHTIGGATEAKNNYEFAAGVYNDSVESADASKATVFTIGDGTSASNRHNIVDIRKNGDMHKTGVSYFYNDVYGPVSHAYVASLGETAELDIILSSLLEQPKYTNPVFYGRYRNASGSLTSASVNGLSETVEIGTYFQSGISIVWPTRTKSTTNGTRAASLTQNGAEIENYLLGYSYGVAPDGIRFKYNAGEGSTELTEGPHIAYALDTEIKRSICYIDNESTYKIFGNVEISYLPSSYMFFQQLYNKGVYVKALGLPPTDWIGNEKANPNIFHNVTGRYAMYWGISNALPTTKLQMKAQKRQWLPISTTNDAVTISLNPIGEAYTSSMYFWCAFPEDMYQLIRYSDDYRIRIVQPDGVEFDLVTNDQILQSTSVTVSLGRSNISKKYKIAYIHFQNPIGNKNNAIHFKVGTKTSGTALI